MNNPKIEYIECSDNEITFYMLQQYVGRVKIDIYTPNTESPLLLRSIIVACNDIAFSVPRYICDHDGCYLRYVTQFPGVQFVTHFTCSNIKLHPTYSKSVSKKGLRCVDIKDGLSLGIHHTVIDLPIQDLIRTYPEEGTTVYTNQDTDYYICNKIVENLDRQIITYTSNDVHVTINLLVCTPVDERMRSIVQHPRYESRGRMSAINVTSATSCRYLEAACEFLAERYTDPDNHLQIDGVILANEISVQGIWSNAGPCTCEDYMKEYTRALRIAWQAGSKYWYNWRVYISLDNHWSRPMSMYGFPFMPDEVYAGRDCLNELDAFATVDGDFNWNIAYHPYASNLAMPDFYNDDHSTLDVESPVVSFKNLKVLVDYVQYRLSVYRWQPRKIILSEQGFNSANDLCLEHVQATAFGHAFKEVMKYPLIEAFIYHSHVDNCYEEGLKLGLRRSADFDSTSNMKPIYHVFKTIEELTYDGRPIWEHY